MTLPEFKCPMVSVIMPTYNHAMFIGEAIESVLSQTYSNLELIIIDNYSEDNTEEIVRSFNDLRIKYMKFRKRNIAAVRNQGIRCAAGEYIAFLDSDDIWLPKKLEKQVLFMEKNKDIFLVYSRCFVEKNGKVEKIIPKKKDFKKGDVFKDLFLSNNFIQCLTVMMRNLKELNCFYFDTDEKLRAIEDYDLWLKIAKTEKIDFIDEPLAVYRIHGGNISAALIPYIKRYTYLINKWSHDVGIMLLIKKCILFFLHIYCLVNFILIKRILRWLWCKYKDGK